MPADATQRLLDESDIRDVVYRYCRAIDRRDFAAIHDCFHADATDEHGRYVGDIPGLVAWVEEVLEPFASTTHFIGNLIVELDGDVAWVESYCQAMHRTKAEPAADWTANVRYVDRFERRAGTWRIARRRCVFSPGRIDPVVEDYPIAEAAHRQVAGPGDPVFARSLD